jgi:N-acyl homoserine lactone hydrolase
VAALSIDVEIRPLRLAKVELPDFHPEAPGSDTIYGFLVRDGEERVLVDTGVGVGSSLIDRLYQPERVALSAALASVDCTLEQVTALVNSHLHFDHCGNNSLFPGIPIYVQKAELDAARLPHYTVRQWVDFPNACYVAIEGRHSISEHLELVPTPGHTPGHQSLVVRSSRQARDEIRGEARGEIEIIVAQAAYAAAEFEALGEYAIGSLEEPEDPALRGFIDSNGIWSREAYLRSLSDLYRLNPDRAFFSHDPTVWECPARRPRPRDV